MRVVAAGHVSKLSSSTNPPSHVALPHRLIGPPQLTVRGCQQASLASQTRWRLHCAAAREGATSSRPLKRNCWGVQGGSGVDPQTRSNVWVTGAGPLNRPLTLTSTLNSMQLRVLCFGISRLHCSSLHPATWLSSFDRGPSKRAARAPGRRRMRPEGLPLCCP